MQEKVLRLRYFVHCALINLIKLIFWLNWFPGSNGLKILIFFTAADTPGDLEVIGSSICDRHNNSSRAAYVTSGRAMRITTGAPLPQGADAVVPVEDTLLLREADDVRRQLTQFNLNVTRSFSGRHRTGSANFKVGHFRTRCTSGRKRHPCRRSCCQGWG